MAKKKTVKKTEHQLVVNLKPPVKYAKDYGHFYNPDYPALLELADADYSTLAKVKPGHPLYRDCLASIQSFDANMDVLTQLFHGRHAQYDGDEGPATTGLLALNRCGQSDFPNPIEATGTGAWPVGCDPSRPNVHSIRIYVNTRGINSYWRERLPGVLRGAEQLSASIGLAVRHLVDTGDDDAEQAITFGSIPGGVIGWNYLPQANTCRQTLAGKIDTGYRPADKLFNTLLWVHESHGHGIGLPHTRGGIMNPSIIRSPLSWRNDPSYSRLRRFYGGEPIPGPGPDPGPTPGPTPPTGKRLRGVVELEIDGQLTGDRWVLAPI